MPETQTVPSAESDTQAVASAAVAPPVSTAVGELDPSDPPTTAADGRAKVGELGPGEAPCVASLNRTAYRKGRLI
jgi:sarcosine oxidase gamma subunit